MSQEKIADSDPIQRIGFRIKVIRTNLGLTQDELAEKIDTAKVSISRWETGLYEPPIQAIARLAKLAPQVNTNWILTGEGPMLDNDDEWTNQIPAGPASQPDSSYARVGKGRHHELREEIAPIELQSLGFALIPLYAAQAGAGEEKATLSEAPVRLMAFHEEWIRGELRRSPADLFLLSVEGDSMFPTLVPGELLLVDRTGRSVSADAIYLIRVYDGITVKRCQWNADGLHLLSDNPAYKERVITRDELDNGVQILGRVIWGGRRY